MHFLKIYSVVALYEIEVEGDVMLHILNAKNITLPHSQFKLLGSLDPTCYQNTLSTHKSVKQTDMGQNLF